MHPTEDAFADALERVSFVVNAIIFTRSNLWRCSVIILHKLVQKLSMVSTRSASNSPVKKEILRPPSPTRAKAISTAAISKPTLDSLQLLIAPKNVSTDARFILLLDPKDETPKRYLFCPQAGVFELTRVSAPKNDHRSILFAPQDGSGTEETRAKDSIANGYVNKIAEYMTATPYDLCFTFLPLVVESGKNNLFQSLEDFLDSASKDALDLKYIIQKGRDLVENALESICDTVEAGDEKMYRYSQSKTLQLLIKRAKRACQNGLPISLEERFVTRLLEAPVLSVKREESTISISKPEPDTQNSTASIDTTTPSETFDSQSSAASDAPSAVFSEASITTTTTIATTVPDSSVPDNVKCLQRLLIAFKFISASYISPSLATSFLSLLQSPASGVEFTPLNDHLALLAKLRAEAAALNDFSSYTRKRGSLEDDEEAEIRAEKKRRLEEEEKRKKASTSRGVKDLAKVDVKGMKKMSAFFAPKGAKAK